MLHDFLNWAEENMCSGWEEDDLDEGTFMDKSEVFNRDDLYAAFQAGARSGALLWADKQSKKGM